MAPIWGEKPQDFLDRLNITAEQTYDGKTTLNYNLDKRNVYGQPVNNDVNVQAIQNEILDSGEYEALYQEDFINRKGDVFFQETETKPINKTFVSNFKAF